MKRIIWAKVPENTLVYVWDEDERPEFPTVKYFNRFDPAKDYSFVASARIRTFTHVDSFKHADLVLPDDIEKYTVDEKEPIYRPCKNWEEFKQFFGKIAKEKNGELYRIINYVDFRHSKDSYYWYFEEYELVEPVNGSTVIGVKEA